MKEYRCVKLGGVIVPKNCRMLNGSNNYCKYFMKIKQDKEERKDKFYEPT